MTTEGRLALKGRADPYNRKLAPGRRLLPGHVPSGILPPVEKIGFAFGQRRWSLSSGFQIYDTGSSQESHFQLWGYALLLEDLYQKGVDKGFIYIISKDDAVVFDLSEELKRETLKVLGKIRPMVK